MSTWASSPLRLRCAGGAGVEDKGTEVMMDVSRFLPQDKSSLQEINEGELKLVIARWLSEFDSIKAVYEEKKHRQHAVQLEPFEVHHTALSPDLLVKTSLKDKEFWIALELKICNKHLPLLNAYDQLLSYFLDYVALGARYEVDGQDVLIDTFALATNYSPVGYLFEGEGKYDPDMIENWKAYPVTTTYARVLFHQRSQIRKALDAFIRIPRSRRLFSDQVEIAPRLPHLGVVFQDPGTKKRRVQLLYSNITGGFRDYFE